MEFQGIRLLLGLNQSQFAEHLGVSRTTVYRLESNLLEIDNRTLYAARYLQFMVSRSSVAIWLGITWDY
ncbi:hypothetical protein C0W54_08980 [Photobacterium kishitanii]|uniref:helix-turn-helix domain-containing protein n=1 Tax=Photobacterium kishitanii TaxID=318456 RepID=UPI000D17A0C1|nr:hypothetical protein C0W54_08980 [Photobacterium kishitanii]